MTSVPVSSLRAMLGLPRWSQHPLKHTQRLRLTAPYKESGRGKAISEAVALQPTLTTPTIVSELWTHSHEQRAVMLIELAARTGLPLGVVCLACEQLVDVGVVDYDSTAPLKIMVVASTQEAEFRFIGRLAQADPARLGMEYLTAQGGSATTEIAVSPLMTAPPWPTAVCLVGSPRDSSDALLWEQLLRDTALMVLLDAPDTTAARTAVQHSPAVPRLVMSSPSAAELSQAVDRL